MRRLRTVRLLLISAAISSLAISGLLWHLISPNQEMWPLPAAYLLEMVLLPAIAVSAAFLTPSKGILTHWVIAGAILGFTILGTWSIGFAYIPVFILVGIGAFLGQNPPLKHYLLGFTLLVLAGAAQVVVMLAAIRLLYPSAVF